MLQNSADDAIRILILEDNEIDFLICERHLENIPDVSYNVTWVKDIKNALRIIKKNTIDCCLIDYNLGLETGIDFLKQAVEINQNTTYILLTGMHEKFLDMKAMKAGAVNYINKDKIDSEILERTIRYALLQKDTQKKMETDLQHKTSLSKLYKDILSDCPFGICDISQDNNTIFMNGLMKEIFSIDTDDITSQDLKNILKKEHYDFIFQKTDNNWETQTTTLTMEIVDRISEKSEKIILSKSASPETGNILLTAIKSLDLPKINGKLSSHYQEAKKHFDDKNNVNLLAEFEARHIATLSKNFENFDDNSEKFTNSLHNALSNYYINETLEGSGKTFNIKGKKNLEFV